MSSGHETKVAGRNACFLGMGWSLGLLALAAIQRYVWHSNSLTLFPIFGLLTVYLVVAGAFQWATGWGGIKARENGLTPLQFVLVQCILFTLLAVGLRFV